MANRTKILIAVLAMSFMAMVAFLLTQYGAGNKPLIFSVVIGIALVLTAMIALKIEANVFKGKSVPKVMLGSLGLSFGLMLLMGVLALPFFGDRVLDAVMGHNSGIIWLAFAILVSPISARYIK